MGKAITLKSVVPIRKSADETSEMVSQLLFGEEFTILAVEERWLQIESCDNYVGWIDRKMASLSDDSAGVETSPYIVSSPVAVIQCDGTEGVQYLSMGSMLTVYDDETEMFRVGHVSGRLVSGAVIKLQWSCTAQLLSTARHWLNVPYLWGGRTIMGVDCSGFVQIVFRVNGVELPRDARDQAQKGRKLGKDEAIQPGDVAFFCNPAGDVIHVGILLACDRIIHSSGEVRIDKLDEKGIFREDTGKYTHTLHAVVRMIG